MNNPDILNDQLTFQLTFGHGVLPYPQIPNEHIQERRRMLVSEEFNKEFMQAWEACCNAGRLKPNDLPKEELEALRAEALAELGDAIADSIYVLVGTAYEYGIPIAAIWRAVQNANMSKLWTTEELANVPRDEGWKATDTLQRSTLPYPPDAKRFVVHDQHGKVRKPPSWKAPDIKAIVREPIQAYQTLGITANYKTTPAEQQANRDAWNKAVEADKARAAVKAAEREIYESGFAEPPNRNP
jgi:hypothetical protein